MWTGVSTKFWNSNYSMKAMPTLLVVRVILVVARDSDMGTFFYQGTIGRKADLHLT